MARVAVVGVGMMGEALVRGLLTARWKPEEIVLANSRGEHVHRMGERLGVPVAKDNRAAASAADSVLLAVKPVDAASVLEEMRGRARGVVSIVMGLPTAAIERHIGAGVPVVRAMPNTPARVGKGVTALTAGAAATPELRQLASDVFGSVGPVVWVAEKDMDAVTALSGSGPAYVYLVAEAMIDAGVAAGLQRDVATTLTYATIEGAARMLAETGEHPAALRAQVTSPGGTTAAAITVLEAMAVRAAFIEAVRAATRRSQEQAAGGA